MRRIVKKQILEIIQSLEEALQYMKHAPEDACRTMAEDCRMCTKTIADALDAEKQAEQDAPAALARFDQTLDASLAFLAKRERWIFRLSALQKQLIDVKKKIQEIKARLEVVFLPYKASMWDSLESIWRAADADPDCDAYVVPIPYYDLNPDHTPAKFHYEGNLYPEDVPMTDYRKYDLATRRPDAIYIHNPYDGYNRVTSVDPAYYSDRLKQYTEMLVYVPYDVVMDGISEHMCKMPGVQRADRVIVQSEKIKRIYVKYMPEEKILALGSPKIDKVLWTQEHPPAMPEEWAKIARGRKLILYNTHLSPLIIDDGSVCRKLRYVFSVFKERNDVCLLWRPHPLSEATMQAMNPKPLKEYMSLVEAYKHEQWGIYDDSPDVHCAITLSDAYYGDMSSLVPMYGVTGKPIMIQNLDIFDKKSENEFRFLSFSDAAFDSEYMWFSAGEFNSLFKMELKTGKVFFVALFPGEKRSGWLYSAVIKYENKLFFIPSDADVIAEFNIDTMKFKMHHFMRTIDDKVSNKFVDAYLEGDTIWMIPGRYKAIVKFNVITGAIENYSNWLEQMRKYETNIGYSMFATSIRINDTIWCPFREGNIVIKFDLKNMESEIYVIGDSKRSFFSIAYDGEDIWLLPNSCDSIFRWNPNNNKLKEYKNFPETFHIENNVLSYCFYWNKGIWFLPGVGNKFLKFDLEKETMEENVNYPKKFKFIKKHIAWNKFLGPRIEKNSTYVFQMKGNMMLEFTEGDKRIKGRKVCISEDEIRKIRDENFYNISDIPEEEDPGKYLFLENGGIMEIGKYLEFICEDNKVKIYKSKNSVDIKKKKGNERKCGLWVHQKVSAEVFPEIGKNRIYENTNMKRKV